MTGYTFNQLFDFTRTTAGTFVGSNGLVQTTPASVNLLTFTQEFDNAAWVKGDVLIIANSAIAPDGTSTADKLVENVTTSGQYSVRQTFASFSVGVYTLSFYAKAAERNWTYFEVGNTYANVDLLTGTVGATGQFSTGWSFRSASATPVGNGWYRCVITANCTIAGSYFGGKIHAASANNVIAYNGVIGSGIFIWGAQLELGSTATTYARNNGGVFPPRFEYDPVTLAPRGILIEEQRTNLVLYSEQLDNAAWVKQFGTITSTSAVSPSGAANADVFTPSAQYGNVSFLLSPTISTGSVSVSVWLRVASGTRTVSLRTTTTALIYLSDVTVTSTWTRFTASFTYNGVDPFAAFVVQDRNASGFVPIEIWGAQLEVGAFATSYIPTVASQVTRTADVCTISAPMFAPWYNQNEGTWAFDFVSPVAGDRTAVNPSDGTNSNRMTIGFTASSPNNLAVFTGGALQALIGAGTQVPGVPSKMAAAYRLNDFASTTNGAVPATDTSGTVPTVNQLNVGSLAIGGALNGHIRRVQFYPFRASNNQLQALST